MILTSKFYPLSSNLYPLTSNLVAVMSGSAVGGAEVRNQRSEVGFLLLISKFYPLTSNLYSRFIRS